MRVGRAGGHEKSNGLASYVYNEKRAERERDMRVGRAGGHEKSNGLASYV